MKTYHWQDICNWTGIPYREHGTYQVECPFCARQGKKHRMYVDADKRVYHCFHCQNKGHGRALRQGNSFKASSDGRP